MISGIFPLYVLKALLVVPKGLPLPEGALIMYAHNVSDEHVVEFRDPDDDPALRCLPHCPLHAGLSAVLEPLGIGRYGDYSEIVPFHVVGVSWRGIRQLLGEREKIGFQSAFLQLRNKRLRVT